MWSIGNRHRELIRRQISPLYVKIGCALDVHHNLTHRITAVQIRADLTSAPGNFKRAVSAEDCPDKDTNGKAVESQWRVRRSDKRRWTTSMGSIGGALTPAYLISHLEDCDTPATSTVVSAAASEVASDSETSVSLRPSLRDGKEISKRKTTRITFEGLEQLKALDRPDESDEEAEDEDAPKRAGSDTSSIGKKSDASSMNWRADALDVGENLAAEAAAKKGHTSVDSIVALVQAERERWEEERQALEVRVEELQEQLRSMQAAHSPDAEKQALKREHQELRKVIKARSRFGAWVCERHMMESDDEETDAEKEELRRRISELSVKLRAAKVAAGAASSESDVSPIRRSPGPIIRRRH
ncbi:unnamed protein product [Symbiodinium sp. KB8]|nr:unnamed protein product [Symbiodinium sp. KB8]